MTGDGTERSSTIRVVLGKKLREARVSAGMELSQLAKFKLGVGSTISRIETGKVPVLPYKVVALCKVYGVDQSTADELEALAFRASEDTIFDEYSDVIPRWFSLFVHLEASASRILAWEGEIVPGLLQTAAYSRAVFEAYRPALDERTIERSLAMRQERQRAFFGRPNARVLIVLGEGVLARQVGGALVAEEQRQHLAGLDGLGRVEVRVLTWSAGAHAAMEGSFRVLEFEEAELNDVVYAESASGAECIDKAGKVPRYREMFEAVQQKSIPLEEYTL